MKIDLNEIHTKLEAWQKERGIIVDKENYIINIMKEFNYLLKALRDYEKIKNGERAIRSGTFKIESAIGEMIVFEGTTEGEIEITLEVVEQEIIHALCNITKLTLRKT